MDLIRARDSHPFIGSTRRNLASQRTASSIYYLTFFYRVLLALFLQETNVTQEIIGCASSIYYLTFFYRVFLALFLQETNVAQEIIGGNPVDL